MPILESILVALAPHLIDLVVDIFTAEQEHPGVNKGYAKHDSVMGKLAVRVKEDRAFDKFENRDIMDVANVKIKEAVKKFNDNGILQKGELSGREA